MSEVGQIINEPGGRRQPKVANYRKTEWSRKRSQLNTNHFSSIFGEEGASYWLHRSKINIYVYVYIYIYVMCIKHMPYVCFF